MYIDTFYIIQQVQIYTWDEPYFVFMFLIYE